MHLLQWQLVIHTEFFSCKNRQLKGDLRESQNIWVPWGGWTGTDCLLSSKTRARGLPLVETRFGSKRWFFTPAYETPCETPLVKPLAKVHWGSRNFTRASSWKWPTAVTNQAKHVGSKRPLELETLLLEVGSCVRRAQIGTTQGHLVIQPLSRQSSSNR